MDSVLSNIMRGNGPAPAQASAPLQPAPVVRQSDFIQPRPTQLKPVRPQSAAIASSEFLQTTIARPQQAPNLQTPQQPTNRPASLEFRQAPTLNRPAAPALPTQASYQEPIAQQLTFDASEYQSRTKSGFKKRYVFVPLFLIVFAVSGIYLRQPLTSKVASLMAPPSPFSQQLVENIGFPLYYPTKMPAGFKFETKSIEAAEGVVMYVISDDNNKIVSFSMQSQTEGMTTDSAINSLKANKDSRKLNTPVGEGSVGTNEEEKLTIANVLTGKTWVLINMPEGTLSNADIDLIFSSLKQAK